ncbi:MAG: glutaminase, partial [Kovacikia sp.]
SLDAQMLASVRSLNNEVNRAIAEILAKSGYLGSIETTLDTYNQICCLSGTVADLAKIGLLMATGTAGMKDQRTGSKYQITYVERISSQESPNSPYSTPKTQNVELKTQNSSSTPHPLNIHHLKTVNALMLTCGLYEASGRFAVRIGLPTKSGVSGALLSIVPGQGAIACYSPALDSTGNSVAGLFLLETLAQELDLSIFSP